MPKSNEIPKAGDKCPWCGEGALTVSPNGQRSVTRGRLRRVAARALFHLRPNSIRNAMEEKIIVISRRSIKRELGFF
jgi:hypothetical protein